MLEELQDGKYDADDKALQEIRKLISTAYPEAYETSSRKSGTPAPAVEMTSLVRSGLAVIPQQVLEMYGVTRPEFYGACHYNTCHYSAPV